MTFAVKVAPKPKPGRHREELLPDAHAWLY
jgi:hypothetical protein